MELLSPVLAIDVFVLLCFFCVGSLMAIAILRKPDPLGVMALAIPLGVGTTTWMTFVLSLAGMPLSRGMLAALVAGEVVALALLAIGRRVGWRFRRVRLNLRYSPRLREQWVLLVLVLILLLVIGVAAVISLGRAHSRWDEIVNWAVKGYGIAAEGTITAADRWGSFGRTYPLNVHLVMSIFQLVDSDVLPGSKLVFPALLLSMTLGCIWFWRELAVPDLHAVLAGIFLATIPVLFIHATLAYANLTFTTYIVLGTIVGILGTRDGDTDYILTQGLLYGMAAWTRTEGIGFILALGLVLLAVRWRTGKSIAKGLLWIVPAAVVVLPWWLFSAEAVAGSHLGSAVVTFIDDWSIGNFHVEESLAILMSLLSRMLTPSTWGLYLIALVGIGALGLAHRRRPSSELLSMFLGALVTAMLVIGIFYIRSYSKGGYAGFLERAFDRAFFPAAVMLWIAAIGTLGMARIQRRQTSSWAQDLAHRDPGK